MGSLRCGTMKFYPAWGIGQGPCGILSVSNQDASPIHVTVVLGGWKTAIFLKVAVLAAVEALLP